MTSKLRHGRSGRLPPGEIPDPIIRCDRKLHLNHLGFVRRVRGQDMAEALAFTLRCVVGQG